jgi:hypothetical protein
MNIEVEPETPQSLLTLQPLNMIVQVLDASHVRVGFMAN